MGNRMAFGACGWSDGSDYCERFQLFSLIVFEDSTVSDKDSILIEESWSFLHENLIL